MLALVALLTGAVVAAVVGVPLRGAIEPLERTQHEQLALGLKDKLRTRVGEAVADVRALQGLETVTDVLGNYRADLSKSERSSQLETERGRLASIFSILLRANSHYLQLRVISAKDGAEVVRVHRSIAGASPAVVPPSQLQLKGERSYVRETLKMAPEGIYVSPIELNEEWGVVQVPHLPTFRTASPVYSGASTPLGLVVLNVDAGPLLDQLRSVGAVYLFTEEGEFWVHPDREPEFAGRLGRSALHSERVQAFARVLQSGQTWSQVAAVEGVAIRGTAMPVAFGAMPVVLALELPSSVGEAEARARRATLIAALIAAGIAWLVGVFLVRKLTRPLQQMTAAVQHFPIDEDSPLPLQAAGEVGVLARSFDRMRLLVRERDAEAARVGERFREVVEAAPNAKVVVNRAGVIRMVNRSAEALFGYSRDELVGVSIRSLLPFEVRNAHSSFVETYFEAPAQRAMGEKSDLYIRTKLGERVAVEIGLSPIHLTGEMLALASIIDISKRKHYERELERSNVELEQFAYVASHDLQEPLRMVANYTELLAQRYQGQLDEKADKYIHYAVDGARRMQRLVNDLLKYSRVGSEAKPLAAVDAREIVSNVLHSLTLAIEEARATIDVSPLPAVYADREQLGQVFQNLIGNALKFRGQAPLKVSVAAHQVGDAWEFSVEDNGLGFDMAYADKVFQMFQRLGSRDSYPGSGIGLAVVKRIIERHGGTVHVTSVPDRGTTFYFTLSSASALAPFGASRVHSDEPLAHGLRTDSAGGASVPKL